MEISRSTDADWPGFLALARSEGWRVPDPELELLRGWPGAACLALRRGGEAVGFVTAVAHGRSGWIGNLLVAPELRGRGWGGRLFEAAVAGLREKGCATLRLTASRQGRPLYERRGFRPVGEIRRWVRPAGKVERGEAATGPGDLEELLAADREAWGEGREGMLEQVARSGRLLTFGGTRALLQRGPGTRVLGPWYSPGLCPRENRQLLTAVLEATAEEIALDVPADSPLNLLLAAAGLEGAGRTLLMARGEATSLPAGLVALASLGSMG